MNHARRLASAAALLTAFFCLAYPAVYPRHLAARMAAEFAMARSGHACCEAGCPKAPGQTPKRTACPVCRAVDGLAGGCQTAPAVVVAAVALAAPPPALQPRPAEAPLPPAGSRDPPRRAFVLLPRSA